MLGNCSNGARIGRGRCNMADGGSHVMSRKRRDAQHKALAEWRFEAERQRAAARVERLAEKAVQHSADAASFRAEMRALREGELAGSYQPVESPGCVYCGGAVEVLDHVPPISRALDFVFGERFLYPACWACNASLGAFPERCLAARSVHLTERHFERGLTGKGDAVVRRLLDGVPFSVCRCVPCEVIRGYGPLWSRAVGHALES